MGREQGREVSLLLAPSTGGTRTKHSPHHCLQHRTHSSPYPASAVLPRSCPCLPPAGSNRVPQGGPQDCEQGWFLIRRCLPVLGLTWVWTMAPSLQGGGSWVGFLQLRSGAAPMKGGCFVLAYHQWESDSAADVEGAPCQCKLEIRESVASLQQLPQAHGPGSYKCFSSGGAAPKANV